MNRKYLLYICFISTLFSGHEMYGQRKLTTLHNEWRFSKDVLGEPVQLDYDDSGWEEVTVPHDWAISGPFIIDGNGNTGKLPWKGNGWYRRNLDIPSSYEGKKVYLIFDGVMAFPSVFVNGKKVGEWDYGYNSFHLDITDYINFGRVNVLSVNADTRSHDSRWYPGAGIYRKVQMLVTSPIHVDIWGTHVRTPIIKSHYAEVSVATTIKNFSATVKNVRLLHIIFNPQGVEVAKKETVKDLRVDRDNIIDFNLQVINPEKWDVDNPALYTVQTKVFLGDSLLDDYKTKFGIRSIKFTPDDGFHLNGRRVQLKGVNLHHDHGPLGAAFNRRAMERQLEIMKSMGVNAIRNSHNVAAPELLELCDEMGLLFFNEIFDKYDAKAGILSDTDFEEFAHRNIKNFVLRDRNHPSVFLWSVGNEIGDVQWNENNGFHRLHTMINYVNKYDPMRPTTLVCDNMESASKRHFDYYDVHSWNYGRRYKLARNLEPNKSVIISESASTLSTRGFYELPLPETKTDFTNSLQVSSYDLNAPEWAEIADDDFMWQQDEPYIAGEFVWTGFDYLGEPTPYDNASVEKMGMASAAASRSSYFGIVDLVGLPKDRYYLYKSYWKPEENTIHILPHWNWPEMIGENVPVFVYTNGDKAELFLNGRSQGFQHKKPTSKNSTERFRLMWKDVIYETGELKVVAYKDGLVIGEEIKRTVGKAKSLKLSADRLSVHANGEDLSYVTIEAVDENGVTYPLANDLIKINLTGKGQIEGVGNGNPQSFNSFKGSEVYLFNGKAMVILGAGFEQGIASLTVSSSGLKKASIEVVIK